MLNIHSQIICVHFAVNLRKLPLYLVLLNLLHVRCHEFG